MNEASFWAQLSNNWARMHWVRIENTTAAGTPDVNFCYKDIEGWAEIKMIRGEHLYLEKFQPRFHLLRNSAGGISIIFARDTEKIMVLLLDDIRMLNWAIEVGKFKKFHLQTLKTIVQWTKPFDWDKMFVEFMEKMRCLREQRREQVWEHHSI